MNDNMRFGSYGNQNENREASNKEGRSRGGKIYAKLFSFAVLTLILVALSFFGYFKMTRGSFNLNFDSNSYSAVFLSNGQVYFGKIKSGSNDQLVLAEVFYLQTGNNDAEADLNEPRFSLVKLGNELHGPKDSMYINMNHVLFYEELRGDSQVVQSIKNFKN